MSDRSDDSVAEDPRPEYVFGPVGERLTLDMLPPPSTRRWIARRKAEVVAAVRGGLLTHGEACMRWNLSTEELESWQRLEHAAGLSGLRTTKLQYFRNKL